MTKISSVLLRAVYLVAVAAFIGGGVAHADTEGPNLPGTTGTGGHVLTGVEGSGWSGAGNITASDDVRAQVVPPAPFSSVSLNASNFGFNIPTGAVINGIEVFIEGRENNGGTTTFTFTTNVLKGGVQAAGGPQNSATPPTTEGTLTLGGSSDLWGEAWTPADINAANFGVTLAAWDSAMTNGGNFEIDAVSVTVHFTTTPGAPATTGWGIGLMAAALAVLAAFGLRRYAAQRVDH